MTDKKQQAELPADEGHRAFRVRKTPDENIYCESAWKYCEWKFGRDCEVKSILGLNNHASERLVYPNTPERTNNPSSPEPSNGKR